MNKKIAVNFPDDVYNKIKRRAAKEKTSFSAKAVDLIKCGLLDIEESELHDKPKSRSKQNEQV